MHPGIGRQTQNKRTSPIAVQFARGTGRILHRSGMRTGDVGRQGTAGTQLGQALRAGVHEPDILALCLHIHPG